MKPRHSVCILSVFSLLVLLLSAELLYRKRAQSQLAQIWSDVGSAHPDWKELDAEFIRFDAVVVPCEPSLVEDAAAWIRLTLGRRSALRLSETGRNPYLQVELRSQRGTDFDRHVFLWSPRRLRFVHRDVPFDCRRSDCPWRP